jgi:hypothetical protein
MLCVVNRVADCARPRVPPPTEWQRIGNQIDAAMIFARANFINVLRVSHCACSYHFVVAVWRAKEAYSKYDHRPVALRIELEHKVDDHLILMRLMIRE